MSGKVLILPEVTLKSPLHQGRLVCLDRYRGIPYLKRKLSYYDSAVTQWPEWVYRNYDPHELVNRVLEELKSLKLGMENFFFLSEL